ncbi:MAG: L,D-transpeptidase [Candidatus Methylacidiphilales bacterium]
MSHPQPSQLPAGVGPAVALATAVGLDLPDTVIPLPQEPEARARLEAAFRAGMSWVCIRSDTQRLRVHAAPHLPQHPATDSAPDWHTESPGFSAGDYPPPPVLWETSVSTAAKGLGEEPDSYRTPRGWHVIAEKFGDGLPEGSEFKSRKPTGRVWRPEPEESTPPGAAWTGDLILSRILWLDGLEASNHTSHDRFIYFHGTNREDQIGTPASHGCIRLRNKEMLHLYDLMPIGTPVYIS